MKPVFGIVKIGRHSCMYKNEKYILTRYVENVNETFFKKEKRSIQKCFVFRYIMSFTRNNINCLCIKKYGSCEFITSFDEDNIKYDKKIEIPNVLVNSWFGDFEHFLKFKRKMFKNIDLIMLRIEIENVISKINEQYLSMSLKILQKIEDI